MTGTPLSSRSKPLLATAALASFVLAGCATQLPRADELPDLREERAAAAQRFVDETPVAIERIQVPRSSMKAVSVGAPLPARIADRPIEVSFPGQLDATLTPLVETLGEVDVRIAFQWSNPTQGEEILSRKLPFLSFRGTVGELFAALRTGLGIVTWYENGLIYISNQERYAVTVPQNKEVIDTVAEEIRNLGADNVVTSLRGGSIVYTASPDTQDRVIGPFLERMARNLAVVNMQVAVVSLALNDNSEVGFDWNAFQVAFNSTAAGMNELTNGSGQGSGGGQGGGNAGEGGDAAATGRLVGTGVNVLSSGLTLSNTSLGNVFGTYGALSVSSAVKYLSNFGNTNVAQNVSLRTLSGSTMKIQSGQEVPYVSGVSSRGSSADNLVGTTETEKAQTGLTLEMTPLYDSDAEVVTVEVEVTLDAILDFVELSAGAQIGSITQPLIQKQNMNDIVRMQAGRTVVIGGLQYDSESTSGNEPALLRRQLAGTGRAGGARSRQTSRNALFVIMRPTITVFEEDTSSSSAAWGAVK